MLNRKIPALILALTLATLSLAGCAEAKASEATTASTTTATAASATPAQTSSAGKFNLDDVREREISLVDRMGEAHIMGKTQLAFGEALKELSDGKITYVSYLSGEIDTGATHVRDMFGSGLIGSARAQLELMGYYGYEKGAVFGLPYLFADRDHFWKFADSELGQQVLDDINAQNWNLVALAYIEEGARHFFTTKEISAYQDLKGKKIRVQNSDIYVALVEAFGASATPMAWGEVYGALSTGVVDGAENPYTGYQASLLNEVAPYILEDGHIFAGNVLAVSSTIWNELNDTEKSIFKEAAKKASAYNHQQVAADEAAIKKDLLAKSVKIIELSDADKDAIYQMVQPLYKKFAASQNELVDQIRSLR